MTYGELKIECLKLMFANNGTDIHSGDLPVYEQDENYRFYLAGMPGAINRALSRIEERRVLTSRSRTFRYNEWSRVGAFFKYDLARIRDFFDIERLVYSDGEGGYDPHASFETEGDTIVIPYYAEGDGIKYTLIYKPKLERVFSYTDNDAELDLPEGIAAILPYYVKGDLFRDDEPDEASEARNWFEQALDEIAPKRERVQERVESVYDQTGW